MGQEEDGPRPSGYPTVRRGFGIYNLYITDPYSTPFPAAFW
jgi:hypothetical protein